MDIHEVVQFDDDQYRVFEHGFRWHTIAHGLIDPTLPDSEKEVFLKNVSRISRKYGTGGNTCTRAQVVDIYAAWSDIKQEIQKRIHQFEVLAGMSEPTEEKLEKNFYDRILMPFILNPKQFSLDMKDNLTSGLNEVQCILDILKSALDNMKSPMIIR